MYSFILEILMMSSLGIMIYMVARAVPRIEDEVMPTRINKLDKILGALPLEKIDTSFNNFLEKILRKFRLVILKLDNALGGYLNNLRKMNGNGYKNGESKPTIFTSVNNANGNNEKDEIDVMEE